MKAAMLIVIISSSLWSMVFTQPIEKRLRGYYQHGERLSNTELISLMESDKEAQQIMMSAKDFINFGNFSAIVVLALMTAAIISMNNSDDFLPSPGGLYYGGLGLGLAGSILTWVWVSPKERTPFFYLIFTEVLPNKSRINHELELGICRTFRESC